MGVSLDKLGTRLAMVIRGPTSCNAVRRVQDSLGQRYPGLFSRVAPPSPVEMVGDAAGLAKELDPARKLFGATK